MSPASQPARKPHAGIAPRGALDCMTAPVLRGGTSFEYRKQPVVMPYSARDMQIGWARLDSTLLAPALASALLLAGCSFDSAPNIPRQNAPPATVGGISGHGGSGGTDHSVVGDAGPAGESGKGGSGGTGSSGQDGSGGVGSD